MGSGLPRRLVGILSTFLVATASLVALAAPAHAEDGFRYWHYYHLDDGAWAFAEVGPADYEPEDGSVEGFRFGTSTMRQPIEPRADLDEVTFDAVCEGTEAAEGEKRVAVVLDFGVEEKEGTPPDPRGECAVAEESATTQQVLETVADLRLDGGLMCAIDGYPASGCGDQVADAQVPTDEETVGFALPAAAQPDAQTDDQGDDQGDDQAGTTDGAASDGDGPPWLLIGLVALALLIAVLALAMSRRRSAA
jgi:hypothetical protein